MLPVWEAKQADSLLLHLCIYRAYNIVVVFVYVFLLFVFVAVLFLYMG